MAEWIGIGRRARRCYGFDEIALVPGTVTVNAAEVDTTWAVDGQKFRIPFIVLSQLTRGPEHEKRRPVLSDLRESGSIEQDANVVVFIHPKEQPYGDVRPCEYIVAKQRNGPTGLVHMNFLKRHARFEEATAQEAEEVA